MEKRPYEKPTIVRVALNHDQAVLTACSTLTASISNRTGPNCVPASCRRKSSSTGRDSGASS